MKIKRLLVFALGLAGLNLSAAPLRPQHIPPDLAGWRHWVLYGEEHRLCPFLYSDARQRRCAWPTALRLDLHEAGGSFEQTWHMRSRSLISLPGDAPSWPQEIKVDGEAVPVSVARDGRPAIVLDPGLHTVTGIFEWGSLPESLALPADVGLVRARLHGERLSFPEIDADGQLWLRGRDRGAVEKVADKLTLSVTREIVDEIPLELLTRVELEVAGKQREIEIGPVLLGRFIPLRLSSPLPARLEDDGRLRVQVRPGRWVIEFAARHPEPVDALGLSPARDPWPKEEVWAFDARNHLRLVEVSGVPPVDPRQTTLPTDWHHLPAYLLRPGETMRINTIRRGDPQPEPDQLHLNRTIWLDFDGGAYTIQDRITGSMTQGWRLQAKPELALGQVSINGEPQLITRLPKSERTGVEVRRGQIELTADSRYAGEVSTLSLGWTQDFRSAAATLHLPPGWRLLAAGGVDRASGGWVQRWTLLDLFLVLIAAIAVARLWSWPHGLLALATLALIWHEPGAPRFVWLHILGAIALLRVLPQNRFASAVKIYRNLSLVALFLIGIPFLVDQVRLGLYPQLEQPWRQFPQTEDLALRGAVAPPIAIEAEPAGGLLRDESARVAAYERATSQDAERRARMLEVVDPDARVQTGPGLPLWQWTQIGLTWNGPLKSQETITLSLLSPNANLALNGLRVALVAALTLLMLGFVYRRGEGFERAAAQLAAVTLVLPLLSLTPADARADIPSPELLQEFKTRLLAPPECLPACAQIARMTFDLSPYALTVRLQVHAHEAVAVPLPAQARGWLPSEVSVDGRPAAGLARTTGGELLVELRPGLHQVTLQGPLPPLSTLSLPLPLRPHRVEYKAEGWTVEGVHENGQADSQLEFTREQDDDQVAETPALAPSDLPPFVRVERTLRLGLEWHAETRIIRASPPGAAIIIEVPLLPGEAVTTEGVRVVQDRVQVNMGPGQEVFAWQSALGKTPLLTLMATETLSWTEIWRIDASTIWHADSAGIPPIHHQSPAGQWLPEWRPWPGEQVRLNIVKPEGAEGAVLTIDSAGVQVAPGKSTIATVLALNWHSSQGGQHTLTLPENMQLQTVTLDGVAQPIRQEDRQVTLPVTPTETTAVLSLRGSEGMTTTFTTPAIDLGIASVNTEIEVRPGTNRWVLLIGGPELGPAVLFWGVLVVVAIVSYGLGRTGLTPLNGRHWFLLGLGLTQTAVWVGAVVVGWLLALGLRARIRPEMDRRSFNAMQIGLGCLTVVALLMLFEAIKHGLLGLPEMQIGGNGSTAYHLRWYQDRSAPVLPEAWIFSVPLWMYRLLMLAWALWLAFAVLAWLRWGWSSFSAHGLWRQGPEKQSPEASQSTTG